MDWYTVSFSESYKQSIDEIRAVVSMPYMIPKPYVCSWLSPLRILFYGDLVLHSNSFSLFSNSGDAVAEAETELWADFYKVFLTPDEEPKEPMSDLIYPIVDDELKGPSNKTVVGMLAASMYWREMIRDILPQGSDGIHIVFENTCTESFTYQINGPQVLYLGVGDQHDKSYDNLKIERHLNGIFEGHGSTYSGAPMDHEHCQFSLFVYPSGTMKDSFATKIPISFTFAVLATFAFTSAVFLTYDAMVEKRQKKVLNTAERSTAIVSSLFPSAVRDRLYPAPEVSQEGNTLAKLNGRLGKHTSPSASPNTGLVGIPIAEFYPDTTVLFADIVGFTAWSSSRQPTQVFHLLETLFGAFDVIARQRGVFKVETVGDCYVAVVGLPTPRSSHAVVMARFAHDIRDKIRELTVELEKSLGPVSAICP